MKEKLEYYLVRSGFMKLVEVIPGFSLFFMLENKYVNAILIADLVEYPQLTREQYETVTKKVQWKFTDGGCVSVHILSLILTFDADEARLLRGDDPRSWIILEPENELVIDESQVEDFYGMKGKVLEYLASPFDENMVREEALTYNAKGQRTMKSIWERPVANHLFFIVNVIIFTLCVLTEDYFYDRGIMYPQLVSEGGQYYRLFTAMFLHADITHLVSNMILLYFLGDIVERGLGHIKYFLLYLLAGLCGSMLSLHISLATGSVAGSLGASGAIFGMIGALLWIVIRNKGHLETMTTPKVLFLIGYSLYEGFRGTNIDNAAHIGGLIAGFLLAMLLYRKKKRPKKL